MVDPSAKSVTGPPTPSIGWRAILPAVATVTVGILPGFLTAGLAVQMSRDIGLTLTGLGAVVAVFFTVSAVASPMMGRVVQRVGWARSLRASAFLAMITLAGIALSARTPAGLAGWFVLGGLSGSLGQPAANLTVALFTPAHRRGLLFGIKHAAVPAAIFLGGISVPAIALTIGWRWVFWGGALLALLTALLVPHPLLSRQTEAAATSLQGTARLSTPLQFLIALAVAAMLGVAAMDAVKTFIVIYAVESGISESAAGYLLAGGSLAGISTRIIAGWLMDRSGRADITAVAALQIIGALGVVGIAVGSRPGLILGGLVAFIAGLGWSGLFTFSVVKDNPEAPAVATSITQTGVFAGAAIGPLAFGALADRVSFEAAWWAAAAALMGAGATVLYVRRWRQASPQD